MDVKESDEANYGVQQIVHLMGDIQNYRGRKQLKSAKLGKLQHWTVLVLVNLWKPRQLIKKKWPMKSHNIFSK